MSSNFFAALDDSDDENAAVVKKQQESSVKAPAKNKKKKPEVVEPSTVDERKRPNQHDRNTKHGRGGRMPPRDGKRAYDRRSGTGRGKEIKKGGAGARNWGSDKNEARQAQGHVDEDDVENKEGGENKTNKANEGGKGEEQPKEEDEKVVEDNRVTYEEYMKSKQEGAGNLAPVKERKVENEFANVKPKEVAEEEVFFAKGGKQKKTKAAKNKEKKTVPSAFRVANADDHSGRSRGGGRGRDRDRDNRRDGGGGRGSRGRDGPRGSGRGGGGSGRGRGSGSGRGRGGASLNVNDEQAFPSL